RRDAARLQEIGIEVLRAVRQEHHERHQQHEICEAFRVTADAAEHVAHRPRALLAPRFRLGHFRSDVKREQRRHRAEPEHRTPAPLRLQHARCDGREQIADRISALQDSRENAAPFHRYVFHRQRCTDAPLAAHSDAEQRAQNQELRVRLREAAEQFDDREVDDVRHQRTAAAEAIRERAEDQRADRTERERERRRGDDQLLVYMKCGGEIVVQKDDDEEIECVERPAEEACENGVPGVGLHRSPILTAPRVRIRRTSMTAALQGSLHSFKLPYVLSFLATTRHSGTLTLTRDSKTSYVFFDNGAVIYAGSNQEDLRLSAILLRKKRISRSQFERIDALMLQEGGRFGQLAIQQGILTDEQLHDYLKVQVSEIIYDCFVWPDGAFTFVDELTLPPYAVTIAVDLSNLIMEGARRIEEWEHCLQLLPDNKVVFRVVSNPDKDEKITLSRDEWKILFMVNGQRTLEDLCHDAEDDPFQVYRVVYGLFANKLIEETPHDTTPVHDELETSLHLPP